MKHRHRRMILSVLVAALLSVLVVPEIPAQIIAVPRSTTTTVPRTLSTVVAPPTILPNITGYTPVDMGQVGGTITFNGLNLVGSYFVAKIGGTPLTITSRSATQIVATLPAVRMAGDLTVGYSNLPSPIVLKAGYRVYGKPIISGVSPTSFRRGDIVTVTGTDLFGADRRRTSPTITSGYGYVRLGTDPTGWITNDYLYVSNWNAAPDGTQLTFQALDMYTHWYLPIPGTINPVQYSVKILLSTPQPSSLSGPLRLDELGVGAWSVVGPPVTWSPAGMALSTLEPPLWGSQKVDFVVTNSPTVSTPSGGLYSTTVNFTGAGLNGATIQMGGQVVGGMAPNLAGVSGFFSPAYGTISDYVTFSKEGNSVRSATPLKIVSSPRMQDTSLAPITLPLNTDITITGWDLLTTSVPGMTYEFRMYNSSFAACNLSMQVVSHTPNQIKYRINTTGTISQSCLGITDLFYKPSTAVSAYRVMQLFLKYGGVEREYWRRPYLLLAP
jgi:hypothetical protein